MPERHIHLVVDALDPRALAPEDLPILPAQLPYARCGEPKSAHGRWSECPLFERPALPDGHAYVDELSAGVAFHFLDAGRATCVHLVSHRGQPGRLGPGLVQVEAHGSTCGAARLRPARTTVVRLEA